MDRYICIHGHFYQPPRENPWLEAVEPQDSAYPYHDWNERITAECYAPNAVARILNSDGRIVSLVNNYARMSFDFGPTLLSWLEKNKPAVYQRILDADVESRQRFGGHGSALAHAYNHMILPLANFRDRYTQTIWGIRDFEHRFGRTPEGMWLPETAVDVETLEVLSELNIRFTILSPHQCARWRQLGEEAWHDVDGCGVDPTHPYIQRLPSGRSIAVFFYDGSISRAVAFETLLCQGESLVNRLASAFSDGRSEPQLVHIATDGESYGHHRAHGDMALAYALEYVERHKIARLTNYGEYLAQYPPQAEVEIRPNTSWSCSHGIERWRSDCGCNTGRFGWNQAWRRPLRLSLDWLRDEVASRYEQSAGSLLRDPWTARDQYIDVILDRSPDSLERFFSRQAARELTPEDKSTALKLLEMQRYALLMYTSCGWYFDELSGLESVQVLQFAARAIQLAGELFEGDCEARFLKLLESAQSNLPEPGDARAIYEKWVKPMAIDWNRVAAHYALSALFEAFPDRIRMFCYEVERQGFQTYLAGKARAVVGHARFRSDITAESTEMVFAAAHLGGHNVNCGVRPHTGDEAYTQIASELAQTLEKADFAELIRVVDRTFGESTYTLRSLFRDQQRKVLRQILQGQLSEAGAAYRRIYEEHLPTMRFLGELGIPQPKAFQSAVDFLLNTDIRWHVEGERGAVDDIRVLLQEARSLRMQLDMAGVSHMLSQRMTDTADSLCTQPAQLATFKQLDDLAALTLELPCVVDIWHPQNVYFELLKTLWPELLQQYQGGEANSEEWLDVFVALGDKLRVCTDDLKKTLHEVKSTPSVRTLVRECFARRCVPRATYRLQFNCRFTFRDATAIVPYLHELGISHCYASPIFQARPGSEHGYDVCDHSRLNSDLGTEDDFRCLTEELRGAGMGLIADVVPNHMGIGDATNAWWLDVLENGTASVYASCFDIDWEPSNPVLNKKVLLPVLGDQFGRVLEAGEIRLAYESGAFFLRYFNLKMPVAPDAYIFILERLLARVVDTIDAEDPHLQELRSIVTSLNHLPPMSESTAEKIEERQREKEVIKRRLATLCGSDPVIEQTLRETINVFNGNVGDPHSFDLLENLLNQQAYRLAYWRVATEEINYRRFFDINELAAICTEKSSVFKATHQLVLRLLSEGSVCGLRLDHPDGLWNPAEYTRHLQDEYVLAWVRARMPADRVPEDLEQRVAAGFAEQLGRNPGPRKCWPLYVVAEKILCEDESLPDDWAVDGTTGYDFLAMTNGLLIPSETLREFDRIYSNFIGDRMDLEQLVQASKKMIMLISMAGEINALSHQLDRISERNRQYRDFTLNSLTFVIREVIACLKVYRSYVVAPDRVSGRDRRYIEDAVARAKRLNPRTAASIFDFVRDTLLLDNLSQFRVADRPEVIAWVMKFQQLTGPVMAKGVEDTAYYAFNRLVSLCEVGSNPNRFGVSISEFHQANAARVDRWPNAMLATTTHDTKRSEDVRARVDVLAEMPDWWEAATNRWAKLNAAKRTAVDGQLAPDRNEEYLLYETLVGSWPELSGRESGLEQYRTRVVSYMEKATREAKVHTSWVNPDQAYDAAVREFVCRLLPDDLKDPFIMDLAEFVRPVVFFGRLNSLTQTLLKLTCPGVPDFYQGSELWALDLVDPDNRRPVAYDLRRDALAELKDRTASTPQPAQLAMELLAAADNGLVKMYLIYRVLSYRTSHPELFEHGSYEPLECVGEFADHVVAFSRSYGEQSITVVAPRLMFGLMKGQSEWPLGNNVWKNTGIRCPSLDPGTSLINILTDQTVETDGGSLALGAILQSFPVAVLDHRNASSGAVETASADAQNATS